MCTMLRLWQLGLNPGIYANQVTLVAADARVESRRCEEQLSASDEVRRAKVANVDTKTPDPEMKS